LASSGFTVTGLTVGSAYTAVAIVYRETDSPVVALTSNETAFSSNLLQTNSWQTLRVTFQATSTSSKIGLVRRDTNEGQVNIGGMMLVPVSSTSSPYEGPYFDGDTAGGSWDGTPHQSISTSEANVNTTDTYWAVNGVSLQTFAYNIQTLGGDRLAPPSLRGSDTTIPYRPGRVFTSRVPDSRVISLGMWVQGSTEDGRVPNDVTMQRKFLQNWEMLRNLLWSREQFTLTKMVYVPGTSVPITVTAKASFAGGLVPQMTGGSRAVFTVDLFLSDPFFYGDQIEVIFPSTTRTKTLDIIGDDRTNKVEIEYAGAITNGVVTNTTRNVMVRYNNVVLTGEKVVLDSFNFSALHTPNSGSPYRAAGYVTHSGDPFWLYLEPGQQTLTVTTEAGAGTVRVRYQPAFF